MSKGQRIGYIRVSTIDQNTERQLDGIDVDRTFTDKASGKDTQRPQLKAALEYAPRAAGSAAEIRTGLEERREQDVRLGRSSWGPHHDELKLELDGRSLRRYGSQGQQRAALLALLFAEREVLLAARRVTPLLILDDVMSELDPSRRERLVTRLAGDRQTLITAAAAA